MRTSARLILATTITPALVLASLCSSQGRAAPPNEPPPPAEQELPHVPALPPAEAVKAFHVDPGLKIELAAAEPNVCDPVDVAFDEDGRMWVAEIWNYPGEPKAGEPLGRVRVLESTRGDGVYDKSTVFAEGLKWCSSVLPWDGGAFVVSSPDVLYIKDTKGTGKADLVKKVYTGFRGKTYEVANSLRLGIDNKVYVCGSYAGGTLKSAIKPEGPEVSSRDFRFDPIAALAGAPAEAVCGGGEWGNAFDDFGERFNCDATDPIFHAVLPREYLARNPNLLVSDVRENPNKMWAEVYPISAPEPWKVARQAHWDRWKNTTGDFKASRFPANELAPHGFATAAAGIGIYRGDALPGQYRNCSYTGEPANNVVIRLELKQHGPSFSADRPEADKQQKREFLASTDNRFRPVNFADGPDGCLYVVSMYREIIEDESAIPDDILKRYDLYSGREMGRVWRVTPENFTRPKLPHLSTASAAELVAALDSPNGWTRDTAARLLYQRQDRAAVEPLRRLATAAKSTPVRAAALWALRGLDALDVGTLLPADPHRDDPALTRQVVRLAEPMLHADGVMRTIVTAAAASEDPGVRFQAALSLGYAPPGPGRTHALAGIARRDAGDQWIASAILTAVPSDAGDLLKALLSDETFRGSGAVREMLGRLAQIVGVRHDEQELAVVLASLGNTSINADLGQYLVRQTADGVARGGGTLARTLEKVSPAVRESLNGFFAAARTTALDPKQKSRDRVEAVRLMAFAPYATTSDAFKALLDPAQPQPVQSAAIRALGEQDDPAVAPALVALWQKLGPGLRNDVLDALFRRPQRLGVLLDAIEHKKIAAGEVEAARRQTLLKSKDDAIRTRAEKAFAGQINADRQKVIDHYAQAVGKLDADPSRGAQVFQSICFQCHGKSANGTRVGPDLATLEDRSPPTLLVALLDPNREVKPIFVSYDLETKDGQDYVGVIANETANAITIRRAGGLEDTILRANIRSLRSTGLSLMPDGLESGINEQQMADLLAFLRTYRGA